MHLIDRAALARLQAERDERTLYMLDVRSPEEYEAGHLEGARPAPGGQLVQATDAYVGVRNARLVLIDDGGARARMTAAWLRRMGWDEVYVLADPPDAAELVAGPPPVAGEERMAAAAGADVWRRPYDLSEGVEEAMEAYLAWEVGLLDQIDRDGDARFRTFPEA